MNIHLYDDDERQFTDSKSYPTNHGPFSHISIELNKALKKLNYYSDPDAADWVGFNTGLNLTFRYKNKKPFIITVWEVENCLPIQLLRMYYGQKIFGLSNQITKLWNKYNIPAQTIYPGCDTNFWKQTLAKNEIFTFLHVNSSNVRSGIDLTLQAFHNAFCNNKNVKLVIKDTNNSEILNKKIAELKNLGSNIEYISQRMHNYQIRDLYSSSHVCLNLIRMTSFGLPLLECSACNCLCLTGDVEPTNEIIKENTGILLKPSNLIPLYPKIQELEKDYGLMNCYPNFQYPETPLFYDFNIEEYTELLKNIFNNWQKYSIIDTRTPIVNDWTWDKSAKILLSNL